MIQHTAVLTANYNRDRISAVVLKQSGMSWLNLEAIHFSDAVCIPLYFIKGKYN